MLEYISFFLYVITGAVPSFKEPHSISSEHVKDPLVVDASNPKRLLRAFYFSSIAVIDNEIAVYTVGIKELLVGRQAVEADLLILYRETEEGFDLFGSNAVVIITIEGGCTE